MRIVRWLPAALPLLAMRCGGDVPAATDGGIDSSTPADAATPDGDATIADVAADAPLKAEAEASTPTVYTDVTDASNWEVFDIASWLGATPSFTGAAFDGRYMYYAPASVESGSASPLVRYDTLGAFTDSSSWSKFDMTQTTSGTVGFFGAAVVGSALYLVPALVFTGPNSVATRYDTTASFTNAASYSVFDFTTIPTADSNAVGYAGSTYDGHYLYFVPYTNSIVVRYDTTASFGSTSAWSKVDLSARFPLNLDHRGGTYDGRYVYFAPVSGGGFVRYDTQGTFTDTNGAWELSTPNLGATPPNSFFGEAFDGRNIYFAPLTNATSNNGGLSNVVVQYDTTAQFGSSGSWSTTLTSSYGYTAAIFDGRYVNFVPCGIAYDVSAKQRFNRYDTSTSSWTDFDLIGVTQLNIYGTNFGKTWTGGAYDGQYVYFVPSGAPAVRFKTKSPPSMPTTYTGSFL